MEVCHRAKNRKPNQNPKNVQRNIHTVRIYRLVPEIRNATSQFTNKFYSVCFELDERNSFEHPEEILGAYSRDNTKFGCTDVNQHGVR